MFNINDLAPDFCLKNQDEKEICLKDFKGKWIILYFYPKDNTSGCTLEAITFTNYQEVFKKHNAIILGISPDSCESHKKFQKNHNLTITLLSDPNHKVLELYDVWKRKKLYGKEFFGVIRSTFLINPDGTILFIWNKVKVKGHIENVLNTLKKVQKNNKN